MRFLKYIGSLISSWYRQIILRFKYKMKPNKLGTYDLKSHPATPNAYMYNDFDLNKSHMEHNEKYYLINCNYEGFDTIAEGDEIVFVMPSFCTGDYRAKVMKDEKGLFISKRNNFLEGCRDYEIKKK